MPADRLTIKRGDTEPLKLRTAGADLTAATLRFLVRTREGVDPLTVIVPTGKVLDGTDTIVTVPVTQINTTEGTYQVELEATQAGVVRTFPSDGYATLAVIPDLG